MRRTEEEKNLLAKLASGLLDGMVGDEREYRGYRSVFCGKYIKDGEPVSYRQGESTRFFKRGREKPEILGVSVTGAGFAPGDGNPLFYVCGNL